MLNKILERFEHLLIQRNQLYDLGENDKSYSVYNLTKLIDLHENLLKSFNIPQREINSFKEKYESK